MPDPDLDLDDWIDLLSLKPVLSALADGSVSLSAAKLAIDAQRGVYPDMLGDYVKVLDVVRDYVRSVEDAIAKQNSSLREFAEAALESGVVFEWDRDRLLSAAKRAEMSRIESYLEELAGLAEQAAEAAEEGIADLEDHLEGLQDRLDQLEERYDDLEP